MTKRSRNKFNDDVNGEGPTRLKSWQAEARPFEPAPPVRRMNSAVARFISSALPSRSKYWGICGDRTGRIACATKTGRRVIVIVVLLAALRAGTALMASATTLQRMSVAKMTQAAELVVRAQCVANSTTWDGGEIWTFTSFAVEDSWKGAPTGAARQLTVRLLGGSVGNLSSTVSGVPRFRAGEEVILFLQSTARGDYSIVSWVQGTFRIHRDARSGAEMVVQDTAAFDTYDPATRQFDAEGIRYLPVAALRMRVQSALAAQSGEKK
jgi:hypothetical protein